jgi:hypothetical protein
MAKNKRKAAKKASTSLLMLLIIASAILAFVPFRVTLATGSTGGALSASTIQTLQQLIGTHIAIDSLGLFTQTTILTNLVGNLTALPAGAAAGLGSIDYFAMKAQKITVDIDQANGTMGGLLQPFGSGPTLGTSGSAATIQLRVVLLSVTISGYKLAGTATNKYGEVSLTGLNPALIISLDRAFVDLFVDPLSGIGTYLVQADMTVYQGLALLLEAATL